MGEVFKIAKRYPRQAIPMHKLNDWNDQHIIGQFCDAELNKVSMDSKTLFLIEEMKNISNGEDVKGKQNY